MRVDAVRMLKAANCLARKSFRPSTTFFANIYIDIFLEKMKTSTHLHEGAVEMLELQHKWTACKSCVKNRLGVRRPIHFISRSVGTVAGLATFYTRISNPSRQVQASHHGDAHKIDYRPLAVVKHPCAKVWFLLAELLQLVSPFNNFMQSFKFL